jgi:hypothetical protein
MVGEFAREVAARLSLAHFANGWHDFVRAGSTTLVIISTATRMRECHHLD